MNPKTIGVAVSGRDSNSLLTDIRRLEELGIPAAWLTTGGTGLDALTLFASVAQQTERILLGTSIIPTWPRHPLVVVQQVQVLDQLAPGRFRLGLGPSHKRTIEGTFGIEFKSPLSHLREYLHIVKTLLQDGAIEFEGQFYQVEARIATPVEVPVMASALRRRSFELCGAVADGAISWVCPGVYLRDVALPAMHAGAETVGRSLPPLVAHAPVCVHDDPEEVRVAVQEQIATYPGIPFYAQMFTEAGFPEAQEGVWSDAMLEAVVASGSEERVEERLLELLAWGAEEIIVTPIAAGQDRQASTERTLQLVARVSQAVNG